ncbi:hypothetical protein OK006_2221 [Actinobacteria bacterium OK006]|nr:hypothetical protein OK006_2221 [Actinobacteria bacterium OK006]
MPGHVERQMGQERYRFQRRRIQRPLVVEVVDQLLTDAVAALRLRGLLRVQDAIISGTSPAGP